MNDDAMMRLRLQQVAAYRQLCQTVRGSGRGNVFFALLMLFFAYLSFQNNRIDWVILMYVGLAVAELSVGLFKWLFPSAEGVLLDGLILLMFVVLNLGRQALWMNAGGRPHLLSVFIGVWLLLAAIKRFKSYADLRRVFAERPSREQIAWFDDLIREIRAADPETDDLALDLPTRPHWKAKLFGGTAFLVAKKGGAVWVAGPEDFEIARERKDHGTGRRKAMLTIHDLQYPEFTITDATWANYQKWLTGNAPPNAHP